MASAATAEITELLHAWSAGDKTALEKLIPFVEPELRRVVRRCLHVKRPDAMLQTTELVNEAYLRLVGANLCWKDRAHFFGVCAQIMRHLLADEARSRRAGKRGGGRPCLQLDETLAVAVDRRTDLVAIDDALRALARFDARKAKVVELKFFGGLTVNETADLLKIWPQTVLRDWQLAKSWLLHEITRETPA